MSLGFWRLPLIWKAGFLLFFLLCGGIAYLTHISWENVVAILGTVIALYCAVGIYRNTSYKRG